MAIRARIPRQIGALCAVTMSATTLLGCGSYMWPPISWSSPPPTEAPAIPPARPMASSSASASYATDAMNHRKRNKHADKKTGATTASADASTGTTSDAPGGASTTALSLTSTAPAGPADALNSRFGKATPDRSNEQDREPPAVVTFPSTDLSLTETDTPAGNTLAILDSTSRKLSSVRRASLNPANRELYDQANSFCVQGKQALGNQDYVAAKGLAAKASMLADQLQPGAR